MAAAFKVGALHGWLRVASDGCLGVAVALEAVLESLLAVAGWRAWRSRRVSREIGLGAVVLLTLDARVAAFLLGRPLPPWVERVVELHVDPTVRWRRRGQSGSEAARTFQSALWADYDRILHELVPQSPGTAFLVSTWHRVPAWLDRECQCDGFVLEGVRPTWLLQVGEGHRRKAQRRMFGELIGRPVNDRARWRTYVLAALPREPR